MTDENFKTTLQIRQLLSPNFHSEAISVLCEGGLQCIASVIQGCQGLLTRPSGKLQTSPPQATRVGPRIPPPASRRSRPSAASPSLQGSRFAAAAAGCGGGKGAQGGPAAPAERASGRMAASWTTCLATGGLIRTLDPKKKTDLFVSSKRSFGI